MRECLALVADGALGGYRVALAKRGTPEPITVDGRSKFASKALDAWSCQYGAHLEFIRPGKPIDNGYVESFKGRLRDEYLSVETFFDVSEVREQLAATLLPGCVSVDTLHLFCDAQFRSAAC
jgi:putative transposase